MFILKFASTNGWVYSLATRVLTDNREYTAKDRDDCVENSLRYDGHPDQAPDDPVKRVTYEKPDGQLETAIYNVAYLCNDRGDTINAL